MRKTAISVPARLLLEVDRAAKQRGESRSQFIQRLLAQAVSAKNDVEFTDRLNAFFADKANRDAHQKETRQWARLAPAWASERW
jgi:hypothetical protein